MSDDIKIKKHSSSKHDKKHKHEKKYKHEKKHKHEKKDKRDKEDKDENKHSTVAIVKIDIDDFYSKNIEFRVWLKLSKGIYFEDLTTIENKNIFENEFIKLYNKQKLDHMYYDGNIPLEVRTSIVKSQHQWGLKLNNNEAIKLSELVEDVDKQTFTPIINLQQHHSNKHINHTLSAINNNTNHQLQVNKNLLGPRGINNQPAWMNTSTTTNNNNNSTYQDKKLQQDNEWEKEKLKRMQIKQHQHRMNEVYMEEFDIPKKELAGTREHRLDKKRTVGDRIHGAYRSNEDERDGLATMSESALLGGETHQEYASLLDKSRSQREKQQERFNHRTSELQMKQNERDMAFFEKLGIDPSKGKIKIQPRND